MQSPSPFVEAASNYRRARVVFRPCLSTLPGNAILPNGALAFFPEKVVGPIVIGDGIETDISGAHRAGLDALFIAGGIHAQDNEQALTELFREQGVHAVAAMRALQW